MPHGFADVGQGDILTLGDAGPGVACHVGGELGGKSKHLAQFLQMTVDEVNLVLLLPCLVLAGMCDDGHQVRRIVTLVFIGQLLHTRLPTDVDALSRLLAAVREVTALQVAFLQVGDVGQRHAAGVEAEEEDVAREVGGGVGRQFLGLDFLYLPDIDGTFHGLGNACIDTGKGMGLRGEPLFHCLIVDGTQVAHIERGGVGAQPEVFQITLITEHQRGVDAVEGEQATIEEATEAVERSLVFDGKG